MDKKIDDYIEDVILESKTNPLGNKEVLKKLKEKHPDHNEINGLMRHRLWGRLCSLEKRGMIFPVEKDKNVAYVHKNFLYAYLKRKYFNNEKLIPKYDFTNLIDKWQSFLPIGEINIIMGVLLPFGSDDFFHDDMYLFTPFMGLSELQKNPLYDNFKQDIEFLTEFYDGFDSNLINKFELFAKETCCFLMTREELIKEIVIVFAEELHDDAKFIEMDSVLNKKFISMPYNLILAIISLLDDSYVHYDADPDKRWMVNNPLFYNYDSLREFCEDNFGRLSEMKIKIAYEYVYYNIPIKDDSSYNFVKVIYSEKDFCHYDKFWESIDSKKRRIFMKLDESLDIRKKAIELKKMESNLNSNLKELRNDLYKMKCIR